MNFGKFLVILVLGVFGVFLALKIVGAVLGWAIGTALNIVVPLALIVGIVYVVYRITDKKALDGGKRGILP